MKLLMATAGLLVMTLAAAPAQDAKDKAKIDPAKLVGVWELTKSTDGTVPVGATVEFTKDNKLNISIPLDGMKLDLTGTYKVQGDKLTVTIKGPDGNDSEESDTIKTLTDDKVVFVDSDGKETEFTRKKAKK